MPLTRRKDSGLVISVLVRAVRGLSELTSEDLSGTSVQI